MMRTRSRRWARLSLVLLWLWTGVVSLWELQGMSAELLRSAGVSQPLAQALILAGAALDLLLGAALWRWHAARLYLAAGLAMLLMTLLGSLLLPELWLHPLGPLSKNLPIAALLLLLFEDAQNPARP
ncbi:epimerase [Paucibacter sp. KBW04]|nr:epimerase [Paucibacter sp. KBW04]